MPGFPKPHFQYAIDVPQELAALKAHRETRAIPKRQAGKLLLATWNVANLGAPEQRRDPECFALLAQIVRFFDLVAIQEVRDNADAGIRKVLAELPDSWRLVFSEAGGNDERFAFLWDSDDVQFGQLVGKATLEPDEFARAGGQSFHGYSRTPYIGTFHRGSLRIEIVSVHSFFGKENDPADMERRLGETRAVGWWCQERSKDPDSYTKDIFAMGDFNTPSASDSALAATMLAELEAKGLKPPAHETQLGTAVRSENHYDQMLFFPNNSEADLTDQGVFDYDTVVFHDLWESRSETDFHNFTVWALSDHRPLWAQLDAPT
jgi:endonuclease/exonuclease/phosphatase family metal-dependent hydrolase